MSKETQATSTIRYEIAAHAGSEGRALEGIERAPDLGTPVQAQADCVHIRKGAQ